MVACAACSNGWFNFFAGAGSVVAVQFGLVGWTLDVLKHIIPSQVHVPLVVGVSFARILMKIGILKARQIAKNISAVFAELAQDPISNADTPVKAMRRPIPREIPEHLTSSLDVETSIEPELEPEVEKTE